MKNSYLVHRKTGSSYLFRSVVPLDLQPLFGTRQFQLSLGCGILGQSKILSFHLNTITQSIYDSIRKNPDMKIPTTDDIKEILKIELGKSKRHVQHYYLGTNRFSETERLKSILKNEEQEEQFRQELKQDYQKTLKEFNSKVKEVLEENGFDQVPVDSLEFKQLREELIQLRLKQHMLKRLSLNDKSVEVETQVEPQSPSSSSELTIQSSEGSISLSQLCDRFVEVKTEQGLTQKVINEYIDMNNLLVEVLGDIPIDHLPHEHGRKFISVLKQLPSYRTKKYPDKSLKELLELKHVKLISTSTISKYTKNVSTLFNWAIKQGYTRDNVFQGKLEPTRKKQVIEKYFTQDELDLVLGDNLKKYSLDKNRPDRYWVTMISAYSGSRLNETCQMDITDIEEQDGIWIFNLTNDSEDKSIKTKSGNRIVPIHPHLLDLGFLDYVEEVRNQKQVKLFPNLKRGSTSSYGSSISQWFGRYLDKLGIKKKGKNFHSFRHTVVNRLTSKQVYEPFIKELVGHSHGTLTMDVYGGRKPLEVLLNECVVKLDYGIDGHEKI